MILYSWLSGLRRRFQPAAGCRTQRSKRRRSSFIARASERLEERTLLAGDALTTDGLFVVPGDIGEQVELQFELDGPRYKSRHSYGLYVVDTASGAIDGVSPDDPGFAATALTDDSHTVLFERKDYEGTTTSVTVEAGSLLGFYMIRSRNVDVFLERNPQNELYRRPRAFFSQIDVNPDGRDHLQANGGGTNEWLLGWEDRPYRGRFDFDDGLISITIAGDAPTDPTTRENGPTIFAESQTSTVETTFTFESRDTRRRNEFGIFKVDDANGRIGNLLPGDRGYAEAALSSESRVTVIEQHAEPGLDVTVELDANQHYGVYLIQNSNIEEYLRENPSNSPWKWPCALFAFPSANNHGYEHTQWSDSVIRWEDANISKSKKGGPYWEDYPRYNREDFDDLVVSYRFTPTDEPLRFTPIPDQAIDEEQTLIVEASAADPDTPGADLTYSLIDGPPAAVVDPTTGRLTWDTTEEDGPGNYDVTLQAQSPSGETDQTSFRVMVNEVNQAPVLAPIGDQSAEVGVELTFTASATDSDVPSNTLTYSLDAAAPDDASVNPLTGVITWTPDETFDGTSVPLTVSVTDGLLSDSETVDVTVATCAFTNDLAGWTDSESGGSAGAAGNVAAVDCAALMTEGDSFVVTLETSFVVPADAMSLSFTYEELAFDTTDPNFINDAFEVALVDSNGVPLVDPYAANRDAFFNITEDLTAVTGSGVTVDGTTVTVDVSSVLAGETATLIFRLANNDDDTTTSVRITDYELPGFGTSTIAASPSSGLAAQPVALAASAPLVSGPAEFGAGSRTTGPGNASNSNAPAAAALTTQTDIFHYVDWTEADSSAGTASGVITLPDASQVTVGFEATNADGSPGTLFFANTDGGINYWVPIDPYLSGSVGNGPPDSDIVSLIGGTDQTYRVTLSEPIKDPIMAVLSLGQTNLPTSYVFDSPFTVVSQGVGFWGGGSDALVTDGTTLTGSEGHGTIRFDGTFDEFSWEVPTPERWHGFTFGIRTTERLEPDIPPPTITASTGRGEVPAGQTTLITGQALPGATITPGDFIDFETLPGGTPTEGAIVSDEFLADFGVSFAFEDGSLPVIAEVGGPATAFLGPPDHTTPDQPADGVDVGQFFLTDGGGIGGVNSPFLINYQTPVGGASGEIIDIDSNSLGQTEAWLIEALDSAGNVIDSDQLSAGDPGTGDGLSTFWSVQSSTANISTIRLTFNGTKTSGIGLAFDNFSPSAVRTLGEITHVTINGQPVDALDPAGNFFTNVDVAPGINTFELTAFDTQGQTATTSLSITGTDSQSDIDFNRFADTTASFAGVYGRTSFEEDTKNLYVDLATRNDGTFESDVPLLVGIRNISDPTVSVVEPDGFAPDGTPYFDFTDQVDDGRLDPGEMTGSPTIVFNNPTRVQFDYELVFFGKLNEPPVITSLPQLEAPFDRQYSYDVEANDPDNDVLTYSLVTSPAGMTIDPDSGVINWSPTIDDLGLHDVAVEASDGRGGVASQRYTVTVNEAPPNRPPVITSTPVTLARVAVTGRESVPIDLSNWQQVQYDFGLQGPAEWVEDDESIGDGQINGILQTRNADASIFLSDQVFGNSRIEGTFAGTQSGFEYMGFVFGYQDQQHTYLFDWMQSPFTWFGVPGTPGMRVKRIDADTSLTGDELWNENGSPGRVDILYENSVPWEDDTTYTWSIDYRPGEFTIEVRRQDNGELVSEPISVADDAYSQGRFGFYANSTANLGFTGFAQSASVGSLYHYDANAIDSDNDTLNWSLTTSPDRMQIDVDSGLITWAPTADQIGNHNVTVEVSDGNGGVAIQEFVVCVHPDPANHPPKIVSDPVATYGLAGSNNPQSGNTNPTQITLEQDGATVQQVVSLTLAAGDIPLGTSDMIFVVDESGSMAGEQEWLGEIITTLDASLQAVGLEDNRYGLVGFANTARTRTAGGDIWMTAADFATASDSLATNRSGNEDGYRGIDFALQTYPFRDGAARTVVLVTDEDRTSVDNSLNFTNITDALQAANVDLQMVANANFEDAGMNPAFGAGADGTAWISDGATGFVESTGATFTGFIPESGGNYDGIETDYVNLANTLGGVTWDLNFLRQDQAAAEAFTNVFVDILGENIVQQIPIDVVASDPNVAFANLSGVQTGIGVGATATFDVEIGTDTASRFDITFVNETTNQILGTIPASIGDSYQYQIEAIDPDDDALSYTIVDGPAGLTVDSTTGLISWDFPPDAGATYPVTVRVSDNRGGTDEQMYELSIATQGTGEIRGRVTQVAADTIDPANGAILLLTPNGQENSVGPALRDAGFQIIVGQLGPDSIAAPLAANDVDQIWVWNDRSDVGGGNSNLAPDPARSFTQADLDALQTFQQTRGAWIMDGLSWRTHTTEDERDLTQNEAINLANAGGGIVLGADNGPASGVSNSITQHVNEVADFFGFELFIGAYQTNPDVQFEGGDLFDSPNPVDPDGLASSTTSYAELPHGLQSNGVFLETVVFGSPSTVIFAATSPELEPDTFGGQTFENVNHIVTTSIVGGGVDRQGLAGWTVFLDQNQNTVRDPGERFTTTDANGDYAFTGLAADTFYVRQQSVPNWRLDAPASGRHEVPLTEGQLVEDIDFGNARLANTDNGRPKFESTPVTSATRGEFYRYDAVATDIDNDPLSYSLVVAPDGMTVHPALGTVVWIPVDGQVGAHDVVLSVNDGRKGAAVQAFVVNVATSNTSPAVTSTASETATAGQTWSYRLRAQDADDDTVSFSLDSGPAGMAIDAVEIRNTAGDLVEMYYTATWDVPEGDAGTTPTVTIRADDGNGGSDTQTFTLNVQDATAANAAPSITSTPRSTARFGFEWTYQVEATDVDGDPIAWSLASPPAGMEISPTGLVTWTPPGDAPESVSVMVVADDGRGEQATQTFDLAVTTIEQNSTPIIVSVPPSRAILDTAYEYDPTASDADGDELIWSLDAGPRGMSIDSMTGAIRWTPDAQQLGEHFITFSARDPFGATATQRFELHVGCNNVAPVITSVPPTVALTDRPYVYAVRANDLEGDPLSWSLATAPAGMTIDADSGVIFWTASDAQIGSHGIVVDVSDGAEHSHAKLHCRRQQFE